MDLERRETIARQVATQTCHRTGGIWGAGVYQHDGGCRIGRPTQMGHILPNSSRVSLLTYKARVPVRYPELVLNDQDPIQIGHFVAHDNTVEYGGFRTILWDAPKDLSSSPNLPTKTLSRPEPRSHSAAASFVQPNSGL